MNWLYGDTNLVNPDSRTLYPESGNRNQRRGIEDSRNRIRGSVSPPSDSPLPFPDSGIGLRGIGFFMELRKYHFIEIMKSTQ